MDEQQIRDLAQRIVNLSRARLQLDQEIQSLKDQLGAEAKGGISVLGGTLVYREGHTQNRLNRARLATVLSDEVGLAEARIAKLIEMSMEEVSRPPTVSVKLE